MRGWGRPDGAIMINGQKAPIRRPGVRGTEGEQKVGGRELFGSDEQRQRTLVIAAHGADNAWRGPGDAGMRKRLEHREVG